MTLQVFQFSRHESLITCSKLKMLRAAISQNMCGRRGAAEYISITTRLTGYGARWGVDTRDGQCTLPGNQTGRQVCATWPNYCHGQSSELCKLKRGTMEGGREGSREWYGGGSWSMGCPGDLPYRKLPTPLANIPLVKSG